MLPSDTLADLIAYSDKSEKEIYVDILKQNPTMTLAELAAKIGKSEGSLRAELELKPEYNMRDILRQEIEVCTDVPVKIGLKCVYDYFPNKYDIEFGYAISIENDKIKERICVRAVNPVFAGEQRICQPWEVPIIYSHLKETGKIDTEVQKHEGVYTLKIERLMIEVEKCKQLQRNLLGLLK